MHRQEMHKRWTQLSRHKGVYLVLGAIVLVLVLSRFPIRVFFDPEALVHYLQMDQRCMACVFMGAQVVATVLGLPGAVLVVAGGAIFGLLWGTIWSTVGATVGAVLAFCAARYFLHDRLSQKFGHHPLVQRFNQTICRNALTCVLILRFAPISPFNVMNFLLGLTPISLKSYAMGTFIGIIPGTLVYTGLGVSGRKALQGDGVAGFSLALVALVLLSLLPLLIKRLTSKGTFFKD